MKMFIAALTGAAWVGASLAQPISPSEFGATPSIVAAKRTLVPTVAIAPVKGWGKDEAPHAADGIKVGALVRGLQHPRWLYVLPNGDILIAEAEAPRKPDDNKGLSGKVHTEAMMRAGSGTAPSANRITLLRYTDGDAGKLERHVFLHGLNSPIGMALVGDTFYVADSDALLSVPYHAGDTEIHDEPVRLTDLPAGSINHHWTKSLLASPDGAKLYVGVGSNSNAAENGLAVESERAAVWEIDRGTGSHRIYASGLRNPVGLAWEPTSGVLWVAVNERDELGDQVPPDYMTGLRDGAFYGWPFSYYGQHVDPRVKPQNPGLVASAIPPDYALGGHTASLGLCWSDGSKLPEPFKNGMFVGQHGSWNRRIRSGYKVVFVRFTDGKPTGQPIDVLTGFLSAKNEALGRPVGVAVDKQGALLVADDVGNTVWRLTDARGSSGVSGGS